jgi:hypothetical protein
MNVILDRNYVVAWTGHHSTPSPHEIVTHPTYVTLRWNEHMLVKQQHILSSNAQNQEVIVFMKAFPKF